MQAASLVSVILPTYNRAYVLRRAIDSVLAQTHSHLELIVVDDASSDDTQSLLATYRDPRLRVVLMEHNGGAAVARNRGLAIAQGQYIAFQDSDDEWRLEKLEKQLLHLRQHPEAAVSAAGFLGLPFSMDSVGYWGLENLERNRDLMTLFRYGNRLSTPSWVVRRSHLEKAGPFDEAMSTWEDWELSLRLDAAGGFVMLDEPLHIAYDTRGSVKFNTSAYAEALERVMRKFPHWVHDEPRALSHHYWLMATWERASGRPRSARRYLHKALRTYPLNKRAWMTLMRRAPELYLLPPADAPAAPRRGGVA